MISVILGTSDNNFAMAPGIKVCQILSQQKLYFIKSVHKLIVKLTITIFL